MGQSVGASPLVHIIMKWVILLVTFILVIVTASIEEGSGDVEEDVEGSGVDDEDLIEPLLKNVVSDEDEDYPAEEDLDYFYKIEGEQDDEYYDEKEEDEDYYDEEEDELEYYDEEDDEPEYYDEEENDLDYYEKESENEDKFKLLKNPYENYINSVLMTPHSDNGLNIQDSKPDIVIKPRPSSPIMELDNAHVLIMIGSALISFGVVMMIFFACRRSMEIRQKEKSVTSMPFVLSSPRLDKKAPIVKDYQRVPTSTMEYMSNTHIEMYRGEENHPADQPLIQ